MCSLEQFKIDLKGLKDEVTTLDYTLDNSFFSALDGSTLSDGALHVSVSIRKATGFFELLYHVEGTVVVPCDLCLDDMDQPIETDCRQVAKLGSADTEDDDVVMVDDEEGILDLSWLIYELIVLARPIKHVHAPGKCNSVMTQKLQELSGAVRSSEEEAEAIDPRWEALMKLKTKSEE